MTRDTPLSLITSVQIQINNCPKLTLTRGMGLCVGPKSHQAVRKDVVNGIKQCDQHCDVMTRREYEYLLCCFFATDTPLAASYGGTYG